MRRPRKKILRRTARRLLLEPLERRAMLHGEGVLSGSVFLDADGDGSRGASEVGIPGVVIQLAVSGSSVQRSTITDDSGLYTFDELDEATYEITKRQTPATVDGQESSSVAGATASGNVISNIVLPDDQNLAGNNFAELSLRPDYVNIGWFFSTAPSAQRLLRETIAIGEELNGDSTLAATIRAGGSDVPGDTRIPPTATDDAYSVDQNSVLTVVDISGVLINDVNPAADPLHATLVAQASNGVATLDHDGSFTYTPAVDFLGTDSFTYEASDDSTISNVATVTINVNDPGNQPFGSVTVGAFDDAGLLGTRTDLVAGAPAITRTHVTTVVDYDGFSNPPTYGPHHGFLLDAQNNSITPRPTGVYSTEQPDEDLVHNLEHGHVWISYNPNLLSAIDKAALEQLVQDGGTNSGVILTPRSQNTSAIALASWAHLQTLDSFDATQIRAFVEMNRGHSPEGFILAGQKSASSESLTDALDHSS
ncbi:MAG: DUF3105 domain-containing protein [Pirellulaceae bacterium]